MAEENDPFGGSNPFGNIPLFGDLAKALSGQGPLNWDAARQFANLAAEGGGSAGNVDPSVRIALADLARIAEMHVRDVTGARPAVPGDHRRSRRACGRSGRSRPTGPLFTELATSLGKRPRLPTADEPGTGLDEFGDGGDQMMAMMASLSSLMAPSMMGMAVGSMVGRMASRAFGQYDLPIPRADDTLAHRAGQPRPLRRRSGRCPSTRCACGCWPTR